MKTRSLLKILLLSAIFAVTSASARPTQEEAVNNVALQPPIQVLWKSGLNLEICTFEKPSRTLCGKTRMPASVGKVKKIYQGNFVSAETVSWLVISHGSASVCGFGENPKKVSCAKIKSFENVDDFNIEIRNSAYHFSFSLNSLARRKNELQAFAHYFIRSAASAASEVHSLLSKKKATVNSPDPDSIEEEPIRPMAMAEEEECPVDSQCDAGDGGGESGGGGGGGGMPIIIITAPPVISPPPIPMNPAPSQPIPYVPLCELLNNCVPAKVIRNPELYEERMARCMVNYEIDMDECQAYSRAMDKRSVMACRSRAATRLAECQLDAERLP